MTDTSYAVPGVYLETPRGADTRVRGVPLGVTGFIGYARARKAEKQGSDRLWPKSLYSVEDLDAELEGPEWGNLIQSIRGYFENGGGQCQVVGLPYDAVHNPTSVLGGGIPGRRQGLMALDEVAEAELIVVPDLYVVPPGCNTPEIGELVAVNHTILDFCYGGSNGDLSQGKYFAVLDSPPGFDQHSLIQYTAYLRNHPAAAFGAIYYPWIDVALQDGRLKRMPSSGQVAGIFAGLTKPPPGSPPGTVTVDNGPHQSSGNRVIADAISSEFELRRVECRDLLEANVNSIVPWTSRGMVVWGTRTLSPKEEDNQISVRRVLSFVERSIFLGTQWAVFEPNMPSLWKRLAARIEIFLEELWTAGLLVGESQSEAFYVKCDEETNPPEEIDEGRVNILVMVRPVRSVEFIVLKISHQSGESTEG